MTGGENNEQDVYMEQGTTIMTGAGKTMSKMLTWNRDKDRNKDWGSGDDWMMKRLFSSMCRAGFLL